MTQEITKITVTDFMGIGGTVELFPEGSLQIIAGPNGSGKSSFMHAMEEVFDPKGVRIIPKPIHTGADQSRVEILTTKARIVRVWKKNGPGDLTVHALDGAKYDSGKAFIVEATGGALFDPDDFVRLDEPKQREQLLKHVELPFDLDDLAAKRKGFFDARTDTTREVKRLTAQLAAYAPADPGIPTVEVSGAAILAEHEAARKHNDDIDRRVHALAEVEREEEKAAAQVAILTDQLDAARSYLDRTTLTVTEVREKVQGLKRIDTDPITARLSSVEATNAAIRAQASRSAVAAELASRAAEEAALTAKLAAIDKTKADGLAAANFPAGLSLDDTGIVHNGIPFRQLNSAMQDTIALDLATSGDPDLKVVVMKSGDRLDSVRLEAIRKLADERGYFVLMERDRDESREIGFMIRGEASA